MGGRADNFYLQLADRMGLEVDQQSHFIFGSQGGFELILCPAEKNAALTAVLFSLKKNGAEPDENELKAFVKSMKALRGVSVRHARVEFTTSVSFAPSKALMALPDIVDAITRFLWQAGYHNCCQHCAVSDQPAACVVGGAPTLLCPGCYSQAQQRSDQEKLAKARRKENLPGAIVGALLGSLVGVVCIVVLSQLGYVAVASGIVMAVCTLKGYEMLGGKMGARGIVICAILMLVMTYAGDRLDWGIIIAREFETDIFMGFRLVDVLLDEGMIEAGNYFGNLAMLYLFTLGGAIPTVIASIKNDKQRELTYRLHKGDTAASPVQ